MRQEARGKRQEARGKRQEARGLFLDERLGHEHRKGLEQQLEVRGGIYNHGAAYVCSFG
jgi:hypothetical protein